jgi:hypothetical protein
MAGDFESLEDLLPVSPLPMMGRKKLHKYKYRIVCKRGHILRGENLVIRKSGNRTTRTCKMCHDASRARWKANNPDYKTPKRVAKPTRLERIAELEKALLDVLVYTPDYMHGMPRKHYEKIARGEK